jgi:hypothetical protein
MTENIEAKLGPLAPLLGIWEGDKGDDIAPSDDRGIENNKYRERFTFSPLAEVNNHEQRMFGLQYSRTAWRLSEKEPFHEEIGYWLWDPMAKQVIRSFMIPRGVTVLAGGSVDPNGREIKLSAEAGSDSHGICSNQYLCSEFKTMKFECTFKFGSDGSLTYEDLTYLKIKGQNEIFLHSDRNVLRKRS